jgi:hypothetical protein
MAPEIPTGEVHFGRYCLAGAADLAFHGKPASIADGTRCREFGAERLGQLFDDRNVVLFLDAAAATLRLASQGRLLH